MKIKFDQNDNMLSGLKETIEYIKINNINMAENDVYDFGVCTGDGTLSILYHFKKYGITYDKCYGFDSLEGLPKEKEGIFCPDIWQEKSFNIQSVLGMKSKDEAVSYLANKFKDYNFELISGYFSDSLTDNLHNEKNFKPALFLSVDVDLYISTYQLLDYMYKNNLIVKDTIIRYDEYGGGNPPAGEEQAHIQMCEKYNKEFDTVYYENGIKVLICKR